MYRFTLESFKITDTRSLHHDTDYVSVSLAAGSISPVTQIKAMGNLNNGTFRVDLPLDAASVSDRDAILYTYAIVNNGHGSADAVQNALRQAGTRLAQKAADAAAKAVGSEIGAVLGASIGTTAVPVVGTALGTIAGWLMGEVGSILFANCDGPVAAGVRVFTPADLAAKTQNGQVLTQIDHHPGIDSPHGCGHNSSYYVTWTLKAI
jgi:hypothetical protein